VQKKLLAVAMGLVAVASVVGYAQASSGTRPEPAAGRITFLGATGCGLTFSFEGFPPGSGGVAKILDTQKVLIHEFDFTAPSTSGSLTFDVSPFLTDDQRNEGVDVGFKVSVQHENHPSAGYADLLCPLPAPPAPVTTTEPAFTG
jgi:hypothetical protein